MYFFWSVNPCHSHLKISFDRKCFGSVKNFWIFCEWKAPGKTKIGILRRCCWVLKMGFESCSERDSSKKRESNDCNPLLLECNAWLYILLELLWQNLISTLVRLGKAAFPSGFSRRTIQEIYILKDSFWKQLSCFWLRASTAYFKWQNWAC